MTNKPKTGRILRDLRQVAEEDLERMYRDDEEYNRKKELGLIAPTDPVEFARWKEQQRQDEEESESFARFLAEEEAELQTIQDSYPLGTVRPREPRSIHSPVPPPPWKRKLRP